MKTYISIALALISATLAASPCGAQSDAELKAQVQALRQQAAALTQQIQILQQKIDQKADSALQTSVPQTSATEISGPQTSVPKAAASAIVPSQFTANSDATHGYFERKPGDRMTFYVPGGEFTAYGNLDVSVDATTKGVAKEIGADGTPPVGNMGWMPALSTDLSYVGVRGFQSLKRLPFNLIYQLETQIDIAATSGTAETNSNQSNVVKGGLTSRNSFIGFASPHWGSLMLGKTDPPYKNSTA